MFFYFFLGSYIRNIYEMSSESGEFQKRLRFPQSPDSLDLRLGEPQPCQPLVSAWGTGQRESELDVQRTHVLFWRQAARSTRARAWAAVDLVRAGYPSSTIGAGPRSFPRNDVTVDPTACKITHLLGFLLPVSALVEPNYRRNANRIAAAVLRMCSESMSPHQFSRPVGCCPDMRASR